MSLASVASTTPEPWLGYRLFLDMPDDPFLVDHLAPLVQAELATRRIRRFFFLRYGAGEGAHLRVRLQPGEAWSPDVFRRRLEIIPGANVRLADETYDRTRLYFGETLESVYSELLNEATSWLAIDLLEALGSRPPVERWVVLTCLTSLILSRVARTREEHLDRLAEAIRFAESAARRYAIPLPTAGTRAESARATAVARARERVADALGSHRRVRRIARLLERIGRRGSSTMTVSTHSIHLLWNKMGLSVAEEREGFVTLLRLVGGDPEPRQVEVTR